MLVVDDEAGIRDVLKTYIEYEGYNVSTAADGVEAFDKASHETYDVILSDIQMPQMDGLTLVEKVHSVQPDTVIILMTGYASVNTAVEAIQKDVFDYIMKPFQNMYSVVQTIERGIEHKRLFQERRTLIDDLRRANDELTYNRSLLTERVQEIDTELAHRIERMTTLYEISRSISSITDIEKLMSLIMDRIAGIIKDSVGVFWLADTERAHLRKIVSIGLNGTDPMPKTIDIHEGEVGETLREGRIRVFKRDVKFSDALLLKLYEQERISSMIMVPLQYENQILGVLNILFRNGYTITDDDISMIKAIADQASVSIKNAELFAAQQRMFRETIEALATAIDSRDHYTSGHSFMVTEYSLAIARKLDFDEDRLELIRVAGLLHDIGKIGISDNILNKPGRLTDEEMEIIKSHPVLGRTIIESIGSLKQVARIVYHHHEHYDGGGYPDGLVGEDIPLESRILQVADIFHALTSDRIYRKAMPLEKAISILKEGQGTVTDQELTQLFLDLVEKGEISPSAEHVFPVEHSI